MPSHLDPNNSIIVRDTDLGFNSAPRSAHQAYDTRESVRAVLLNPQGGIALLFLRQYGSHKLPGGGLEAGESKEEALCREILEETGCTAEILNEGGVAIEYRSHTNLMQKTYWYLCHQQGPATAPSLSQTEQEQQAEVMWASDIATAISLLEHDSVDSYAGSFIRHRDLAILREAQLILANCAL